MREGVNPRHFRRIEGFMDAYSEITRGQRLRSNRPLDHSTQLGRRDAMRIISSLPQSELNAHRQIMAGPNRNEHTRSLRGRLYMQNYVSLGDIW